MVGLILFAIIGMQIPINNILVSLLYQTMGLKCVCNVSNKWIVLFCLKIRLTMLTGGPSAAASKEWRHSSVVREMAGTKRGTGILWILAFLLCPVTISASRLNVPRQRASTRKNSECLSILFNEAMVRSTLPDPKLIISDPDPQIENQEFRIRILD